MRPAITLVRETLTLNNHISSPEFATLCQSQISLLSQSLGAVWSVIYLAENMSEDEQALLYPFAIYPQTDSYSFQELPPIELSEIWRVPQSRFIARLLPDRLADRLEIDRSDPRRSESAQTKQLILPLAHQETFIGLLVTGRDDREWQAAEAQQIEEIARTISIGRFIELQYHWTQNELELQKNLRQIEHDRLDNLLHQLRNPLTALRTFGKLLLKRLLADDANGKIVRSMLAQSDRFQALLEQFEAESDLLPETTKTDFPSLQSDRGINRDFLLLSSSTELKPISLNSILEPLLDTARAIATERGLELVNYLPQTIPSVMGDLAALREIFSNLVDNALKYTLSGGRVQLDLITNRDRMLGVAIRDTGLGVPAADRERIFERHYRGVRAESDIPGTGLGLAIAQELVEKMHGEIELISPNNLIEDSIGTTFIVWLVKANV